MQIQHDSSSFFLLINYDNKNISIDYIEKMSKNEGNTLIKTKKPIQGVMPSVEGDIIFCFFKDDSLKTFDVVTGKKIMPKELKGKKITIYV